MALMTDRKLSEEIRDRAKAPVRAAGVLVAYGPRSACVLADRVAGLEAERDRLQSYIDEAGDGANLVALLDLYHDRAVEAERQLGDARANIDLLEGERAELLREARARR